MRLLYKTRIHNVLRAVTVDRVMHGPPYSLEPIRQAIMKAVNLDSITFRPFEPRDKGVIGRYELCYEQGGLYAAAPAKTHAIISYSSAENFCWQRFAICKEMGHLLWHDDPRFRSTTPAILMAVVGRLTGSSMSTAMVPAIMSEDAAVLAAVDLLFPMQDREAVYHAYTDGDISSLDLATRFRIPKHYIEELLNPDTHENARRFWTEE